MSVYIRQYTRQGIFSAYGAFGSVHPHRGVTVFAARHFCGVSLAKTAPPLSVLLACIVSAISMSMLDHKKIPLAKVKDAFKLNEHDSESLITELWPQNVFPWELWRKTYDKFWRGVAAGNADMFKLNNPPYPEMTGIWADAPASAWGNKMFGFFSELVFALPADSIQEGLDYLLEETYEDAGGIFPAERESLFASLMEAENGFNWRRFYPIDTEKLDAMLNEKAFGPSKNYYSFIARIFPDTMLVDKLAAVRHLLICEYPFDHEVKGLTRHFIVRVKSELVAKTPIIFVSPQRDAPQTSQQEPISQDQKRVFHVPASLWEWKSDAAVRDAMKNDYPPFVIAYVLCNWCGVDKTQTGRLLSAKKFKEDKTYRNRVDKLLGKAASFDIIKA